MSAVVAALLLLGALLVLLAPLLVASDDTSGARARQHREAEDAGRQDRLLAAIRDLDLDLAMGKISEEDHAAMRRSLEDEAIALLAEQEGSKVRPPGDAA